MLTLALVVGILAFLWTWLTVATAGTLYIVVWITFISWAAFFFTGGEKKTFLDGLVACVSGSVFGYFCILATGPVGYATPWLALSVGVAAFIIVMLMSIPIFKSAPAQFCGFAAYFGALFGDAFGLGWEPERVLLHTAISLAAGVVVGLVSVTITGLFSKPEPEGEAE